MERREKIVVVVGVLLIVFAFAGMAAANNTLFSPSGEWHRGMGDAQDGDGYIHPFNHNLFDHKHETYLQYGRVVNNGNAITVIRSRWSKAVHNHWRGCCATRFRECEYYTAHIINGNHEPSGGTVYHHHHTPCF